MTYDIDPESFTVHFRGQDYLVSPRPNNLEFGGHWWWLRFDDAWIRLERRDDDAEGSVALAMTWLSLNAVHPEDDSTSAERGPAWTASEREPLIVEYRDLIYKCWPAPSSPRAACEKSEDEEPQTHWTVESPAGRWRGPLVDCDDTIAEVVRALRQCVATVY